MKSNVLVTVGLGFIGSHYAKLMVHSGYNVKIVDKETYAADPRRIEDIKDKIDIYNPDICDMDLCNTCKDYMRESIIDDVDIIVNFAAETHVDNSIKDSKPFIHSNIEGVQSLLDIARENDIRFVQISTDEVYGSTEYDDQVFKETDKLNPGNPYSATKAAADLLVLSYFNTFGSNVVITRSSNNYGPYQHIEKFIPRMISLALEGKDIEVYGKGNNIRDWLYVEDNCQAIKKVMEKGRTGDIYNISSYEEKTNNQVAEIIAKRFGVGIKYIEDRPGHDFRYSISCNKIMEELKWEAKILFEEGIEKTIDFYIDQNRNQKN